MRHFARFLCLLLLWALVGQFAPHLLAQTTNPPFVAIANLDVSQFPTLQIALYGDAGAGSIADLPIQLRENGQPQTILADTNQEVGVQLAVVLDPHDLAVVGNSGQPHGAEVAASLLNMIEQTVVVRNQDQLAAYTSAANGELQTIQTWTGEPNLLFNSIVQAEIGTTADGEQLTPLLLNVLEQFQPPATTPAARTLLLFSAGTSQVEVEAIVERANAQNVHLQIIEFGGPTAPAATDDALQAVAQQTNGTFVRLNERTDLQQLWLRLSALRTQRLIAYTASATGPAALEIELTAPDGTLLKASADLAPAEAADLPTAEPSSAVVTPTAEAAIAAASVTTATTPSATEAAVAGVSAPTVAPTTEPVEELTSDSAAAPADDLDVPGPDVVLPGTPITLPRGLLQLALPILLVLLVYFGYRELRERRTGRTAASRPPTEKGFVDSRHYDLEGDLDDLQPLTPRTTNKPTVNPLTQHDAPPMTQTPRPATQSQVEEDDYDEVTVVPTHFDDDEATFRLRDQVEQPVLGVLVRVTNEPNLPQQLAVYGLNPGPGETRKIHIGRHSKNNTVVINDKSISREHAVILQKEGRLYLCDNASTAGTFLNWRRLKPGEELLLRHNDLISFGEIVYEFHTKGEDEATIASDV